jgi:hypothetical protein
MDRRSFIVFPALALITLATLSMISSATQAVGTVTVTPTATECPRATAVPLWVEPVTSPTLLLVQDVVVYIGHGDKVTVVSESGKFSESGDFGDTCCPAVVRTDLLPNTTHHLTVSGHVKQEITEEGCVYGGYTLDTPLDRYGDPLVIQQVLDSPKFFPIIFSQP